MAYTINKVYQRFYQDSVALMRLSRELKEKVGVNEAALMMGSPSNKQILEDAGLLTDTGKSATGGDLILSIQATDVDTANAVLTVAELKIKGKDNFTTANRDWRPKSIRAAVRAEPSANFALISVPGEFAVAEARKALMHDLNVMIFSDNVPLEEELQLKQLAGGKDLLMMGPDCGTAILDGIPIAFANKVRNGNIGVIGASGTGIQEVTSLISNHGGGISQAIGVGGRDLSDEIGGLTTFAAIDRLDNDEGTKQIILISKPPGEQVLTSVLGRIGQSKKPFTLCFIGATGLQLPPNATAVRTLEETAQTALGGIKFNYSKNIDLQVCKDGTQIRGLFSGGTLAAEAQLILLDAGQAVSSNAKVPGAKDLSEAKNIHKIIDLGDDQYTQGRPHPMIDPEVRSELLLQAHQDSNVGVILVDVVIGFGAHADPAGNLVNMLTEISVDTSPVVVASVTGTEEDPQIRSKQVKTLKSGGVVVASSNADATRTALKLLGINS